MRLFESFGNDDKQKKVSAENSITEEKTEFEIQHGKGTGLFENFRQENDSVSNTVVEEMKGQREYDKEESKAILNHFEEKNDTDEAKKNEYETFNRNLDRWQRNKLELKSVSEEIQKDNSEISKIQANLDGQEVKINSVKKQIECKTSDLDDVIKNGELKKELLMIDVDYEADENLLPTLKMDLDSGCMTEEQQVYFSRGIAEVCTESKITSIDELNEILTILFNSEVIDNICSNSKLLELAEKKQNQKRIMATGGTFVLALLLLFLFGGLRLILGAGVAVVGIFGLMGIVGYGIFRLTQDHFLWNMALSIIATVFGGLFGGLLIAIFLLDPLVNLIQEGNFLVIAIISVLFAVLAYIIVGARMKSPTAKNKICSNQALIREARREVYIGLENKQLENLPIITYLYCILNYKTIVDYLYEVSLKKRITRENDEMAKLNMQIAAMQKKRDEVYRRKKYLEQLIETQKQKMQDISSENDELYNRICEWKSSPQLSWLDEWTINPEVKAMIYSTVFCMKHNGNTPLVLESDFISIELVAQWVNAIIHSFQRENPVELLDIALIDFALNANQWRYLLSSTNVKASGAGKIKLVLSNADLKSYCKNMEKEAEDQITFFEKHHDDKVMKEIVENSAGLKTIRELNKYNKRTSMEVNKYHIAIILPENIQREDSKILIRSLSSGAYSGFIPIILKKRNVNMYDEWKLITEKANWYQS